MVRFRALTTKGTTRVTLENAAAWDHANTFEMRVRAVPATVDLARKASSTLPGLAFVLLLVLLLAVLFLFGVRRRRARSIG